MMKALFVFLAITFYLVGGNAAPASDESIKTLFKVMKSESMLDSMYSSIEQGMQQGIQQSIGKTADGKTLTEEQKQVLARMSQRMSQVLASELSWTKMEPLQVTVYRETFDQTEIDGMIDFYKSPIGQAFVNKMPLAMQKSMPAPVHQRLAQA